MNGQLKPWFAAVPLSVLMFIAALNFLNVAKDEEMTGTPQTITVVLIETEPGGETIEQREDVTIWAVEDFWAEYVDYQLVEQNEKRIVFKKE